MRLLTTCKSCRKQLDVTSCPSGASVKCSCGAKVVAPVARDTPVRVVHCSRCGATRKENASFCDYCGSRFTSMDMGWGLICPSCFCRLPGDASFCVACGTAIHPQSPEATLSKLSCTRCGLAMHQRTIEDVDLTECAACGGMWISAQVLQQVVCERERSQKLRKRLPLTGRAVPRHPQGGGAVRYVPCPVCRQLMNRRNFAGRSGVIIDVCQAHGVWLDYQELSHILRFVAFGGRADIEKYYDAQAERQWRRRIQEAEWAAIRAAHPPAPRAPTLEEELKNALKFIVRLFYR